MCFSSMPRWKKKKKSDIHKSEASSCTPTHVVFIVKTHILLCGCAPLSLCIIVSFKHPLLYVLLANQKRAAFQKRGAKFGVCSARSTHLCGSRDLCGGRRAAVLTVAPGRWSLWLRLLFCSPKPTSLLSVGQKGLKIWADFDQCCFFPPLWHILRLHP